MNFKNILLTLALTLLFTSCIFNIPDNKENKNYTKTAQTITDRVYIEQALEEFYKEWKDVKYKFGGNSKKGIDCSAFTQRLFQQKFHLNIPRTTTTQVTIGKKIKKSQLKKGDLVFFKTTKTDRHVGIYIGGGKFMHASIKGVKVTNLDKPFYKKAYWTSRRIIF